jgi:hypothetical protein
MNPRIDAKLDSKKVYCMSLHILKQQMHRPQQIPIHVQIIFWRKTTTNIETLSSHTVQCQTKILNRQTIVFLRGKWFHSKSLILAFHQFCFGVFFMGRVLYVLLLFGWVKYLLYYSFLSIKLFAVQKKICLKNCSKELSLIIFHK